MSTNEFATPSAKEETATRRPLSKTSVESAPKPRKLIAAAPFAVVSWLLPWVEKVPTPAEGKRSKSCCRLLKPEASMLSLSITSTGEAPSISVREILEPVT